MPLIRKKNKKKVALSSKAENLCGVSFTHPVDFVRIRMKISTERKDFSGNW